MQAITLNLSKLNLNSVYFAHEVGLNVLSLVSKIFCCTWTVGCQKLVHYIRMLCTGCFILSQIWIAKLLDRTAFSNALNFNSTRFPTFLQLSNKLYGNCGMFFIDYYLEKFQQRYFLVLLYKSSRGRQCIWKIEKNIVLWSITRHK